MTTLASLRRAQATSTLLKATAVMAMAVTLGACEHLEDRQSHTAGWTVLDPSQRHPIMVTQQRHAVNLQVSRNQHGLTSGQRAQLYGFLEKYRALNSGNSRVVISVPAGTANEVAAMRAVADIRPMLTEQGFTDTAISIEPYHADGGHAPIKVSYTRYGAEAPECGNWSDSLTRTSRNETYKNYGCSQQRNLASMIANPADLVSPRGETPRNGDRGDVVYEKYIKGEPTGASRSGEERASRGGTF